MTIAIAYVTTLVTFVVVDIVWLAVVAKSFYRNQLGGLLADQFDMRAALIFYVVYSAGIVIFAVTPALRSGVWTDAVLYGAMFGFFCYATYDLTNLATLKGWPLKLSLVDMAWGATLTAITALAGFAVASRI